MWARGARRTDYTGTATGAYTVTRIGGTTYSESPGPRRTQHFAMQAKWGDEVIADADLIVARTAFTPRRWRVIWDYQFDDYVNICINGGHRVWASGGNLYCRTETSPAEARVAFLVR